MQSFIPIQVPYFFFLRYDQLKKASQAQQVFGAFEKRAPGPCFVQKIVMLQDMLQSISACFGRVDLQVGRGLGTVVESR